MSDHYVSLGETDDGWSMTLCACGWASPPCPGPSEAADAYGDHRAAVAIAMTAAPIADAARAGVAAPTGEDSRG